MCNRDGLKQDEGSAYYVVKMVQHNRLIDSFGNPVRMPIEIQRQIILVPYRVRLSHIWEIGSNGAVPEECRNIECTVCNAEFPNRVTTTIEERTQA